MDNSNSALLSTTYLGPVKFFTKFLLYDQVMIESHENYQKQSYRNRCIILTANGPLSLTIPVTKHQPKVLTRDIRIDNSREWQKNHWNSIESAYSSSPFFEFLKDDFLPFYREKYTFLLDYNMELQHLILTHLEVEASPGLTEEFIKDPPAGVDDLRACIHPKKSKRKHDDAFQPGWYFQVFRHRYGFVSNLSIIDLLFNEGPNAENILKQSIP